MAAARSAACWPQQQQDGDKQHLQNVMSKQVPPATVETSTVAQLQGWLAVTPAGIEKSFAQNLAALENVLCEPKHMTAFNENFNRHLLPIQASATPLPEVAVCILYGNALPATLYGSCIREEGQDWDNLQAYQLAATKKAEALLQHDPSLFSKRKHGDGITEGTSNKKHRTLNHKPVDTNLAKELDKLSIVKKTGKTRQRNGKTSKKGRRAPRDKTGPAPGPCRHCQGKDTPQHLWHWNFKCPSTPFFTLSQAIQGATTTPTPASSLSLPVCSVASPCTVFRDAPYSFLPYTAQHLLALANLPPLASITHAAPPTTALVYPAHPMFDPAEYISSPEEHDTDAELEVLHHLQYSHMHDVAHTHPQLWACLQHTIQHHQQHSPVSTAQVSDLRSALAVAFHAVLSDQHAAAVPSDMHAPQTGTQSSDSLPSAGLQAGSEDATPPAASSSPHPDHMVQDASVHNAKPSCKKGSDISPGGEPSTT